MADRDTRSALRSATAALHAEIDARFGGFDLADRDGLTRFLAAQAIGMRACQPRATRFGHQYLACSAPDYWQILRRDLAGLGIAADRLRRFELADDLRDGGVFYVVAGSRMGAAVLRERATAPSPMQPAHIACGFFAAGEGPAMWRLFRQWLVGAEASDADSLAALIAAARATFQLFGDAAEWVAAQPALPLAVA